MDKIFYLILKRPSKYTLFEPKLVMLHPKPYKPQMLGRLGLECPGPADSLDVAPGGVEMAETNHEAAWAHSESQFCSSGLQMSQLGHSWMRRGLGHGLHARALSRICGLQGSLRSRQIWQCFERGKSGCGLRQGDTLSVRGLLHETGLIFGGKPRNRESSEPPHNNSCFHESLSLVGWLKTWAPNMSTHTCRISHDQRNSHL